MMQMDCTGKGTGSQKSERMAMSQAMLGETAITVVWNPSGWRLSSAAITVPGILTRKV
jgi:hypothetical protein